jgi:Ig-like domain from next to BRCA1 gene
MRESEMRDVAQDRDRQDRFAAQLRQLRLEAGNPSFRVMAARSRTVSHTTLHEAAKGSRFPTWTTTETFVTACGGEVDVWRARWIAALDGDHPEPGTQRSEPGHQHGTDEAQKRDEGAQQQKPGQPGRALRRLRRVLALLVGCGALAAAGLTAYLLPTHGSKALGSPGAPAVTQPTQTPPAMTGDISSFVSDVSVPDGTVVKVGQHFVKTWEIANIGSVPWRGRFLERADLPADNGTCLTPGKVPVPDTRPGAHVRISVPVTAPNTPGSCWVGWKMVDGQGRQFLPGARPIYFVVNVAP